MRDSKLNVILLILLIIGSVTCVDFASAATPPEPFSAPFLPVKPGDDGDFTSHFITILFYRPPHDVDNSTPRSLAWDTARNHPPFGDALENYKVEPDSRVHRPGWTNHNIGHTNVHVHCFGHDIWTGITSDDSRGDLEKDAFLNGAGLEIILDDVPGREFSPEEITGAELDHYRENGRMAGLKIDVSRAQCDRVVEFYRRYKANRMDKVFGGLLANPRAGQGGGCTIYGTSFLDVAGLLTPEIKAQIYRNHCLPLDLFNYPGHRTRGSMFEIGSGFAESHFVEPNSPEPHICASYPDPELAFKYVLNIYTGKLSAPQGIPLVHAGPDGTAPIVELDGTRALVPRDPVIRSRPAWPPLNSNPLNPRPDVIY